MNFRFCRAATIAALILAPYAASAAPYVIPADIFDGGDNIAASYVGVGSDGGSAGISIDGGFDAFDGYGVISGLNGLEFNRRSEALISQNVYRFFDSFTNNTGDAISTTISFFGDLGSDGSEKLIFSGPDVLVACEIGQAGPGVCSDPVIAHIRGNNSLGTLDFTPGSGSYAVNFDVTVAPGETVSLLNLAHLGCDDDADGIDDENVNACDGPQAVISVETQVTERGLAIRDGFASDMAFDGLSDAEIVRTLNWTLGDVVVPAPPALGLFGLGALVLGLRRRA